MQTRWPRAAASRAVAAPIPRPPPVTTRTSSLMAPTVAEPAVSEGWKSRSARTPAPQDGRMTAQPTAADDRAPLAVDATIDHDHPAIRALARSLRGASAEETARALYLHVRDEV